MELRVCHLYPDVLNLYGDRGNVLCIKKRLEWRGIGCTVTELPIGERRPLGGFDLFFVGGGQDFEQGLLLEDLRGGKGADIRAAAEDGAAFLCVCGGYQLMGQYYKDSNGEKVPGLGLFDYYTVASTDKRCRCIGNIVIEAQLDGEKYKVIGFENHGGQTTNVKSPFGKVLSGNGNEFESSTEGYMEKSVIATYLHGPLLSKNPKVSDYVISYCMSRKLGEKYIPAPINDKLEEDCRKQLFERLGV